MSESVKIIENGFVVTCDAHQHVGRYAILLKDDRVAELGTKPDGLRARFPHAEVIDASEKILFPGFIDAHYHGESFVLKNWTAGFPSSKWQKYPPVRKALAFVNKEASVEELGLVYRAAYFGALKSGITFLSEFGFDNLDGPFLAAHSSMKRSDLKGIVGVHNAEQLDRARSQSSHSIRPALCLPVEEELTTYNLQTTLRAAGDLKWPVIAHLGETRRGLEVLKRNFQRSAVRVLEEYRLFQQPLQITHLACLEEGDDEILGRLHIPVIINPGAVLVKDTEPLPLRTLLDKGVPLALGSDWGIPDPFHNMRMFDALARLSGYGPLEPMTLIAAHTITAARAMGLQHEIGSIEAGKKADLTFVNVSDLRLQTMLQYGNTVAALQNLLERTSSSQVSDVMINGEFFLREGHVMTYSEEDLKREYRQIIDLIMARTGQTAKKVEDQPIGPPTTPILPLNVDAGTPPLKEPVNEPFEEGFKIIGKTDSLPDESSPQEPPETEAKKEPGESEELPKTARRVFGDDDF